MAQMATLGPCHGLLHTLDGNLHSMYNLIYAPIVMTSCPDQASQILYNIEIAWPQHGAMILGTDHDS